MLNQDTKQKIKNARDILVGKVPDPKAQVEQITFALIYKFMDDMDKQSQELPGGKAQFFTNGYEKYAWSKILDPKLGGHERLELYAEAITRMSENKHIPQLFRDVFKDAFLPYRSPETLSLFLKEINGFSYDHSEDLGDSFEYLLSVLGSQGDAGQFRTPRHIIDFIVEVVDPKKDESVLDPACGTAGFLISAYKHILKEHKNKPLNPDEKSKLMKNLVGYDISPDMVRLSKVNMYLHGFAEPKIYEYDTLSSEEKWDETYDVIMANPPFMTPKGGIRPHKRFSVQANRAEVLFVDYIKEHLRPNGRAGIIVPEGIIFKSDGAYKQLRKILIEDGLYAVLSLPSGIFNPYSNVKTSILFFNETLAKKTDEILFVKVLNDGYDLGSQRRPRPDLPNDLFDKGGALDVLRAYKNSIETGSKNNLIKENSLFAWVVKKEKIAESGDYRLSGDFYQEDGKKKNQKWPMVELGEVFDYEQPTKYIVDSVNYSDEYTTPVLTAGKTFILGYTNETEGIFKSDLPVIIFDDFTTAIKFVDFPFKVKSSAMKILRADKTKADIKFLFYSMQKISFPVNEHKRYWISEYSKIRIPLPPLNIQKQILKEIEGKQAIIENAKELISKVERERADSGQIFERLKCDWVELGEVCDTTSGGTPLKSKLEYYENGNIPWLKSGEVDQGLVYKSEEMITEKGLKNSSAKMFPSDTILVAMYGATAGKVGLLKFEASTNQAICGILPNDKFIPEFLYFYLRSQTQKMIGLSSGGAQPNISQNIIRKLKIPTPPKDIQQKIISMLSKEQVAIEANEQLIEVVNDQINEIMAEV
ncbi:MAG: N-6 DNA methylase [Candidatus Paceibacterota bacterium]